MGGQPGSRPASSAPATVPGNRGDANRAVYARYHSEYLGGRLQAPEQVILGRFRDSWPEVSMLDIGIGTGRTTQVFAPLVRRYLGIDYVERMIELSRRFLVLDDRVSLRVGDARMLTSCVDERFDFVLFSFNGIDSVGHLDRLRVLAEVRQILKDDGYFFFSSHSLAHLPFRVGSPDLDVHRPIQSTYHLMEFARFATRLRRLNATLDVERLRADGWAELPDGAHGFKVVWYYVMPATQVAQLETAGFEVADIYDLSGAPVDPSCPVDDPWLYYLCRISPAGGTGGTEHLGSRSTSPGRGT